MSADPAAAHLIEWRLVATIDGVDVVVDGGPEHLAEWRARTHVQAVRLESRRVSPWQREADEAPAPSREPGGPRAQMDSGERWSREDHEEPVLRQTAGTAATEEVD